VAAVLRPGLLALAVYLMHLVRVLMVVVVVLMLAALAVTKGVVLEDRLPLTAARAFHNPAAPGGPPAVARAGAAQQDQQVERELQVQPDP
jgi:hypothetical protein